MRKHGQRIIRSLLGISILLLLLGIGNMGFAVHKLSGFYPLLKVASEEMAKDAKPGSKILLQSEHGLTLSTSPNLDKQSQHINRLKARIEFYEFVLLGGKAILALSALAFLAVALLHGTLRHWEDGD